jgi:hypothetical protein
LVDYASSPGGRPLEARSTVGLTEGQVGQEVVLIFEGRGTGRPIVIGVVQPPRGSAEGDRSGSDDLRRPADPAVAEVDGRRVVFSAEREVVLRCGEASITLTRSGKVLIRGAYVVSSSSGVNRIKGGSVQIN